MLGTVFSRRLDSPEIGRNISNGIQMLKQLRHPSVLHYHDCIRTPAEITLITERVDVLDVVIGGMDSAEIRAGLLDVVNAMVFLHEKAGISHNSLSASSIFVTPDGRWKLGSFEKSAKLASSAQDDKDFAEVLNFAMKHVDEAAAEDFFVISAGLIEGSLTMKALLTGSALSSPLFEIADFLEHIQLKHDADKVEFFRELPDRLREISPESVSKRLIRLFLSRYVMLEPTAHESFIPRLMQVDDILNEELYRTYVVPEIQRIFGVRDKAIRLALLRHFSSYCSFMDRDVCELKILPELSIGMYDVDNEIVAASLRAMADLVPILGGEGVTGSVHTKNFTDGTPKPPKNPPFATTDSGTSTPSRYNPSPPPPRPVVIPAVTAALTVIHPVLAAESVKDEDEDWSKTWGDEEEAVQEEEPVENGQVFEPQSTSDLSPRPVSRRSEKSSIGAEFSLPDIKKSSDEMDFFADMEPKFDSAPSLVDSLKSRAMQEASSVYMSKQKSMPVKFTLFSDKESSVDTATTAEWEQNEAEANGTSAWEAEDDLVID
ncbi:hypothetical protein L596_019944 [Steinernema carpocapsae]|uniref:Protein kinase domain-containing protein n=1 Tax=Steinernema carpocapsae TaxID=34508 RepID=A0A4U5MS56_STECR|nr:hypothetical protein L596_019944 [Steinernema carpocapsae]